MTELELHDLVRRELDRMLMTVVKHRPFTVYWDCGHHHVHDDRDDYDHAQGLTKRFDGVWVCSEAPTSVLCRACCVVDGGQSDVCAATHDHVSGGPCPTVRVIAEKLGLIAAVET